ncbi:hypothetical protein Bca101_058965 [Brassica carinata]
MAPGKHCSLPLTKFNKIYDIADDLREVSLVKGFAPAKTFWGLIESGDFKPHSANQSHIRNPTLCINAKVLSNQLFAKDQASKVTNGELQMLYSGLEDQIRAARSGIPVTKVLTNPSHFLAEMFAVKKGLLMRGSQKKDRCGSLLTPLFKHFEIDLTAYECNAEPAYIDVPYLIKCHILRDESTYMFQDKDGIQLYFKLPQPDITRLDKFENIRFLPEPEPLCEDPRLVPADDDDMEDRILKVITGGCFKGQQERTAKQEQALEQTHRPGKELAGSSAGGERLPWNKRSADRSGSGESD